MSRATVQTHHDLKVYQKAYEASLLILKKTEDFPKEERFAITDQLRRACTSVCANIAEGHGRQIGSDADFRRFLVMAKGSCHETTVWLDYSLDLGFIDKTCHEEWHGMYTEVAKMLYVLISKTLVSKN